MVFWELFFTFLKIGIFNFGGGYAMLAMIQNEVVVKHAWISSAEFTDMVAVSQMTPGPIGINVATYVGYTSVLNAGYPPEMAVLGSFLATFSVVLLPFVFMLAVSRFLIKHSESQDVRNVFGGLRPAIVGLFAAASLVLLTTENFGDYHTAPFQFWVSVAIFGAVFVGVRHFKWNPILMIVVSGILGGILYS